MTSDRIDELLQQTAYPESASVRQALLQVWNELQQDFNKQLEDAKAQGFREAVKEMDKMNLS